VDELPEALTATLTGDRGGNDEARASLRTSAFSIKRSHVTIINSKSEREPWYLPSKFE